MPNGTAARIAACLQRSRDAGKLALFAYITVGFPSLDATLEVATALVEAGVDAIELGIPFSDPLADGPTIQAATSAALSRGVTTESCLRLAERVRCLHGYVPLLFMGYFNPVLQYGPRRFVEAARQAGVDGLIVPDLPLEEAEELDGPCRDLGLGIVPLVAPVSSEERVKLLAARGATFLYVTSRLGVTGASGVLAEGVGGVVRRVRLATSLPLGVGFGISRPAHITALKGVADAAIVGSALLQVVADASDPGRAAAEFAARLLAVA